MIELHLFAVGQFEPGAGDPIGRVFDRDNRWAWRAVSEASGQELFRSRAWWPSPIRAFIDGDRFCKLAVARLERALYEGEARP
jgi:hypothetical protein